MLRRRRQQRRLNQTHMPSITSTMRAAVSTMRTRCKEWSFSSLSATRATSSSSSLSPTACSSTRRRSRNTSRRKCAPISTCSICKMRLAPFLIRRFRDRQTMLRNKSHRLSKRMATSRSTLSLTRLELMLRTWPWRRRTFPSRSCRTSLR